MKFFSTVFKIFLNVITLGTYKADQVANDVLSNSPDGVKAAYQQAKDDLIEKHSVIVNSVAKIQAQKTKTENELSKLGKEEEDLQNVIEGILQALESDPDNAEAMADYNSMDARQTSIDARQEEIGNELATLTADIEEYKLALNGISDRVNSLDKESNSMVADMELAKMREQIETEKAGMTKSIDMSGIENIRNKVAEKKAKVETLKMSNGSDNTDRMNKYKNKAMKGASNSKLADILAAREAAKNAVKAGAGTREKVEEETERKI